MAEFSLKKLRNASPGFWTLALVVANALFVGVLYLGTASTESNPVWILILPLLFVLPCLICVVVFSHVYHLKATVGVLQRLLVAYIELIVLFAIAYFWLVTLVEGPPIEGISSPWTWREIEGTGRYIDPFKLRDAVVDCFHFSVVTMTTLSYGDMLPKTWYAKLMVDAQVLVGISIIAVGLGKLLSSAAPRNGRQDGDDIN